MSPESFDLAVLGGGNAITVAFQLAQAGRKVLLIEADRLGGACPNVGCIPSKLLLGHAEVAWEARHAERFHLDVRFEGADGAKIFAETRAATLDATDGKMEKALPENVTLVRGHGRFVGPKRLAVGDREFEAETILVGTGSRPFAPPIPGLADTPFITSNSVFSLERLPKSIAVLGGGYIGCELATFFAALGVETTIIHRSDKLLASEDSDIRETFTAGFTERVPVRFNTHVTHVAHDGEGFTLTLEKDGAGAGTLEAEHLLVATGRVPNTDRIGADAAGLKLDQRGQIIIDETMRTSVEGVYALGDVSQQPKFTHAAAWAAKWLSEHLLGQADQPFAMEHVPHAVFTSPEIAGVGATEQELRQQGTPYHASTLGYEKAAKGRAVKEQHGLLKLLLAPDGTILGCHIVGHSASVLLHQVLVILPIKPHVSALTDMMYIHPSLSELVRNLARKAAAELSEKAKT